MTTLATVILAAGQGTRMKSKLAKVLHPVGGKPLVEHAVDAAWGLSGRAPVLVVGQQSDDVRSHLGDRAVYVEQAERLGTGHAVMMAADALRGQADVVLVYYADMPLLKPETFQRLYDAHVGSPLRPAVTMLSIELDDPRGFGRVVRRDDGTVAAIVEEAAATRDILALRELNVGVYVFDGAWVWNMLARVAPTPPKNEYYLTDAVEIANRDGRAVIAVQGDDPDELIGINTRIHLAEAEAAMRRRTNTRHMLNGVTLLDPASTYIDATVTIGPDTVIYPNTSLRGSTAIGEGCAIGPDSILENATLGDGCIILSSVVEDSTLENGVKMGPFCHVRGGAHLGAGVRLGNFAEIKHSVFGPGVKMGHFSYLGDADVGAGVNVGAGTITANYDGVNKNRTTIGEGAFLGVDTLLIAPVEIGAGAKTGAGAVVNKSIPEGEVWVGVPARNIAERKKPQS